MIANRYEKGNRASIPVTSTIRAVHYYGHIPNDRLSSVKYGRPMIDGFHILEYPVVLTMQDGTAYPLVYTFSWLKGLRLEAVTAKTSKLNECLTTVYLHSDPWRTP